MGLTRKERGVVCARIDEATHDVFAIMYANRVSAVGILNDQGDLVANLSASDLRRIQPQHFSLLALPVGHFLSRLHSASSTVFCSTSTVRVDTNTNWDLFVPWTCSFLRRLSACGPATPGRCAAGACARCQEPPAVRSFRLSSFP